MGLKQRFTYDYLKDKIGCYNIFEHYFGKFKIGESYHSALRKDEKKSVSFFINDHGSIIYKDFAEDTKFCFVKYVAKLYNISYYQALDHIAASFGLIKSDVITSVSIKPITKQKQKNKKVFKVVSRPFTNADLKWWAQYAITKKDLISYNICSVSSFSIDNYTIYTEENCLRFAYLLKDDDGNGYFKIYTPTDIDHKWVFNAPLNLVYGIHELPCVSDTLIITKSVKDFLVLKKFFPDIIAVQNEGSGCLSNKTIKALKKCFKTIIVWFDCDKPGIKAANFFKKKHEFIPVVLGNSKKTIWGNIQFAKKNSVKDPSDYVKKYGIANFEKWLINKNLIK